MKGFIIFSLAAALLLGSAHDARADEYTPDLDRIRAGLHRPPETQSVLERQETTLRLTAPRQTVSTKPRDSIWNGLLIGAGIGAGGGYLWGRNICGPNDSECFAIAGPVGVLAGAGIGAAVGAILDAFSR